MATSCVAAATAWSTNNARHHSKPLTGSIQINGTSASAIRLCMAMIHER